MTSHSKPGAALRPPVAIESADAGQRIDFRAAAGDLELVADPVPSAEKSNAAAAPGGAPTEASPFGPSPAGDGFADIVTSAGGDGQIKLFNGQTGAAGPFFTAFPGFTGGVRVASGDVDGDGRADIVTGVGPGAGGNGHVKVFSGQTYSEISSFFAFSGFAGGVNVATGDVNGDGNDDIVVGAGAGGGPHVKVFDGATGALLHDFLAFDSGFSGGVFVAAGDFDGDGRADIATATESGSSHVKVFDGGSLAPIDSFFAYGPGFTGGVSIAAGDVNGDGLADLVTGKANGAAQVKVFSGVGLAETASFSAFDAGFTGGVRVGAGDVDSDGGSDIVVGAASGSSDVKVFDGETSAELDSFPAYTGFYFGLNVGVGDFLGAPNTVTGTDGDDNVHVAGDGKEFTGFNDIPLATVGNDVILGGLGDDLNHGGDGVDLWRMDGAVTEYRYMDYGGSHAVQTNEGGLDFFQDVEIFEVDTADGGDLTVVKSAAGAPSSTTVRMPEGSNTFRLRTAADVLAVAVNETDPNASPYDATMLLGDVGRLSLILGGGGNTVSVEGDLSQAGIDTLEVDGRGGDNDTIVVDSEDVETLEIGPKPAGSTLIDSAINMILTGNLGSLTLPSIEAKGVEKLELNLSNLQSATISGSLPGVSANTVTLTTGDGDSELDASGVTANKRVIFNAAGGADTLLGGAGEDILNAGSGDDELDGGGRKDELNGETGHDQILGGAGNDKLNGGQGADTLVGGAGKDKLLGGANADRLRGEDGADRFTFTKQTDSTDASADRILDLAAQDKVDLSKIDADTGAGGNQAFHIVGAFSGDAGELIRVYAAGQDRTYFRADTDGDGTADIVIAADGDHTGYSNFVL